MKKDVKKLLGYVEDKLLKTLHEHPSKEALDRLAIFAGFQDWESFRKEISETPDDSPLDKPVKKEEKSRGE